MKDVQFEKRNKEKIKKMRNDKKLATLTKNWFLQTYKHEYSYHFEWLGLPIIQYPQDILALQEIIWKTKPELIIETGIARGGSLVFSASMLEILGKGRVLGIDIDIRQNNKINIQNHPLFNRISMIEGSSTDAKVIDRVYKETKNKKHVMVILDSNHSHEHVLAELNAYARLVTKGGYLVVFDTIVEDLPTNYFKSRPWKKGDNPKTAVNQFLKTNKQFKIDNTITDKLIISAAPNGYLRRVR